jgi:hypothetical protein
MPKFHQNNCQECQDLPKTAKSENRTAQAFTFGRKSIVTIIKGFVFQFGFFGNFGIFGNS